MRDLNTIKVQGSIRQGSILCNVQTGYMWLMPSLDKVEYFINSYTVAIL